MFDAMGGQFEPQTATEIQLAEMFKELLEIKQISVTDNFIDLGGDSLAATICISRVHEIFKVDVLIEEFFTDEATVANLAALIDNIRSNPTSHRHVNSPHHRNEYGNNEA
jgi:acyl carrier protein